MFANFLYFIIALLIVILYKVPAEPTFTAVQAFLLFTGLSAAFAAYTRRQFLVLKRQAPFRDLVDLDHRFTLLVTRHSILALCVFAVDIWALDLLAFFQHFSWFSTLPTLGDLLFLLVFLAYLMVVWYFSYPAHREIYHTDLSRRAYVYSNAGFSIPVLIPWVFLFGILDIINLLPWELPKQILDTAFGQIGFFLLFLVSAACFAPVLILRFWRCRPLEDGEPRRRIAELCRRSGVTYADIVYWPIFGGRMITAGVMGLIGRFRYILVTRALLTLLTPDEVDQVIAHEIGHVRRKHLLLYLLFFTGFMVISLAVLPLSYYLVFFVRPLFGFLSSFKLDLGQSVEVIGGILLVVSVIIYFRYVFGYFMRNFERQADLFVFSLFRSARPLISTFGKIVHSSGQPADKPNWHHFSIQQRVDYLLRSESAPIWISRHDKKVRNSILGFIVALGIGCFGIYQLNHYVMDRQNQQINIAMLENYLANQSRQTPADASYYFLLGDFYLQKKQYAKAIGHYDHGLKLDPHYNLKADVLAKIGSAHFESDHPVLAEQAWSEALQITPNDPELLNNLAWLAATSQDPKLYDPQKALTLSRKALEQEESPHILDTYAQALFVNGRIQEAIDVEEKALAMNPEDRKTYEDQLAKFRRALNR